MSSQSAGKVWTDDPAPQDWQRELPYPNWWWFLKIIAGDFWRLPITNLPRAGALCWWDLSEHSGTKIKNKIIQNVLYSTISQQRGTHSSQLKHLTFTWLQDWYSDSVRQRGHGCLQRIMHKLQLGCLLSVSGSLHQWLAREDPRNLQGLGSIPTGVGHHNQVSCQAVWKPDHWWEMEDSQAVYGSVGFGVSFSWPGRLHRTGWNATWRRPKNMNQKSVFVLKIQYFTALLTC